MKTLRDRPSADPFCLAASRVHEAGGRGRVAFAVFQALRHTGPVIWIQTAHAAEAPMPRGVPASLALSLLHVRAKSETDLLWSIEETLRAKPVALVIAEPEKPMSLTAGRRLQLAAEAGGTSGLMLIREGAGSNAAETRWDCDPLPGAPDSTLHRWALIKNKSGTPQSYTVHWNGATSAVHLVSEAGERRQSQTAAR